MKKTLYTFKNALFVGLLSVFVLSCSKDSDSDNNPQDTELSATELQTILETDDLSGVADTVLAEVFVGSPTGKGSNDCYEATYSDTGFTVVFNNCYLNGTENVNGTLTVVYEVGAQSAAFTATYEGFYAGEIELNGTRTYSFDTNMDQSSYTFSVTSNMELTMADGTEITENGTKVFGFTFGDTLETTSYTLSGDWTVTIGDDTYIVLVNQTLAGNLSCAYLTSGTMNLSKNGLQVQVDFGDGSCDDIVTIIYPNGAEEEVSLED